MGIDIEWAAAQPWCSGKVTLYTGSGREAYVLLPVIPPKMTAGERGPKLLSSIDFLLQGDGPLANE